ncbi:MAG: hypothetical protein MI864_05475 [Pseudomonadales bacterium]|nr:hypothetical protein [Pseudomonadales bacterium]
MNHLLSVPAALLAATISSAVMALEEMTDEQMGNVEAQGITYLMFENIEFKGAEIEGVAEAGSVNDIAADGSALYRKNYQFSADTIGTRAAPLSLQAVNVDASVNSVSGGTYTQNGKNLGEVNMLRIDLSERAAWQNVDIAYNAIYGNPDTPDANNPNIRAGGTPSDNNEFGLVSIDNLSLTGRVDLAGIPEGYKIESVYVDDGSREAASRQGLLLNVAIDELVVDEWLFETEQEDGIYNADRDMVIKNFRLENVHLQSATFEATPKGIRIAYSDPQPFTPDEGLILPSGGGYPDINHGAYDPTFPKGNLTLQTQMPHSLPSESRIHGMTLDHLVLNIRNE